MSVFMATTVSVLGYWLLLKDFYLDFWILWFCFVVGSCQYCLMKVRDAVHSLLLVYKFLACMYNMYLGGAIEAISFSVNQIILILLLLMTTAWDCLQLGTVREGMKEAVPKNI